MQDTKLLSELNSGLTQMMKIAGKGFKIAMINMLKDNTQDQIGNFSIKVKKKLTEKSNSWKETYSHRDKKKCPPQAVQQTWNSWGKGQRAWR